MNLLDDDGVTDECVVELEEVGDKDEDVDDDDEDVDVNDGSSRLCA